MSALNELALAISPIFFKLLYLSVTAVIIGFVLLLIRRITDKKISPQWKYLMWICFVIALVVPFRFQSNVSVMSMAKVENVQNISTQSEYESAKNVPIDAWNPQPNTIYAQSLLQEKQALTMKYTVTDIIIPLVWLATLILAAIICILKIVIFAFSLRKKDCRADLSRYYASLNAMNSKVRVHRKITVEIQSAIGTPALFGLFRPKILLPEYISEVSDESLDCIMLHELCHCKRYDILVNYLLLILQWVYWFNPILLIFFKYIRQDLELANDSYALKFLDPAQSKKYSLSLVEIVSRHIKPQAAPRLLYMAENGSNVERRIKMIKRQDRFKKNKILIGVCSLAIIFTVAAVFLTTSVNSEPIETPLKFTQTAYDGKFNVKNVSFKKYKDQTELIYQIESLVNGTVCLFWPPNGVDYKDLRLSSLVPGLNTVTFQVPDDISFQTRELSLSMDDPKMNNFRPSSFAFVLTSNFKNAEPSFGNPTPDEREKLTSLPMFADIRKGSGRSYNLSGAGSITREQLISCTFNEGTVFPSKRKMPAKLSAKELMETAKDPGLGVRSIHESGITGKGVSVAIIDQPIYQNHPEFKGKIEKYKEFGTTGAGGMTGAATTSLLVGEKIGTAPGAKVFYAAVPSWSQDAGFYADALNWIIVENQYLPENEKIRVVSVSASPDGTNSSFTRGTDRWASRVKAANDAGILVLDCTDSLSFIDASFVQENADGTQSYKVGTPDNPPSTGYPRYLCAPASQRTVAVQYSVGDPQYQYIGVGGAGFAVPYAAGIYALGWQVRPEYTFAQMTDLLFETADKSQNTNFINPSEFIKALQK